MILKEGDKLLVAHRRLFEKDEARFFVGQIDAYDSGIVKATGHTFVRDILSGQMIEKAEKRTKIFSLISGTLIVYQLPDNTALDYVQFLWDEGRLTMTDGGELVMNLAESPHLGSV
jgi:hypothetical protein